MRIALGTVHMFLLTLYNLILLIHPHIVALDNSSNASGPQVAELMQY